MGEKVHEGLKLQFDKRLRLEFRGLDNQLQWAYYRGRATKLFFLAARQIWRDRHSFVKAPKSTPPQYY